MRDLSIAEAAVIASITQNPSKYNPYTRPENIRARQRLVLQKMYELEFITEEEYKPVSYTHLDVYKRQAGSCHLRL